MTNKTENVTWKLLALSQKNKSKPQTVTPERLFLKKVQAKGHIWNTDFFVWPPQRSKENVEPI